MISIAIQAGGRSSRMGRDKALVELGERPLIEHVLARVRDLGADLLITTNHIEQLGYLNVRLVPDRIPGAGALHGLETALRAAQGEHVLLLTCDAPFVSPRLLAQLIVLRHKADVIIPKHGERFEPLQALYNRSSCLPAVESAIRSGKQRMISFFSEVSVYTVGDDLIEHLDPAGVSFFNVNTEADLVEAENILRRLDQDKI